MTDDDKRNLRPASHEEIEQSLSFALRYDGRKLMKRPDATAPSTSAHRHPNSD